MENPNSNLESLWNDLLWRAQKGDADALSKLFLDLSVTLRPFLESRMRGVPREDREDVLQETLITLGQKLNGIAHSPHRFGLKVMRNKIGHSLRDRAAKRNVAADLDNPISAPLQKAIEESLRRQGADQDLLDKLAQREEIARIQAAIEKLPLFCRTFFLGLLEGQSRRELWQLFKQAYPDLSPGTYRKRIFDCRRKLAELLGV